MNRKGNAVLGNIEVPFTTLVGYRDVLVQTANNIDAFVKKELNPLLGTEKLMNEITKDERGESEEPDAIYNKKEDGFVCNFEGCSEGLIYEFYEIVGHLQEKHGIEPDDQLIEGWTDEHEKTWRKELKRAKKSKKPVKTLPLRSNYSKDGLNDMSMGELWSIARKLGISKKGKKPVLIENILTAQKEQVKKKP